MNENKIQMTAKICTKCGSAETYSYQGHENWYFFDGKVYCNKCAKKERRRRYPHIQKNQNIRRLKFLGENIYLEKPIRTGVCENCFRTVESEEIQQTQMHHTEYDPKNPEKHTIELCVRCHTQEHAKLRRIN